METLTLSTSQLYSFNQPSGVYNLLLAVHENKPVKVLYRIETEETLELVFVALDNQGYSVDTYGEYTTDTGAVCEVFEVQGCQLLFWVGLVLEVTGGQAELLFSLD